MGVVQYITPKGVLLLLLQHRHPIEQGITNKLNFSTDHQRDWKGVPAIHNPFHSCREEIRVHLASFSTFRCHGVAQWW
jgi:hypothetical protein